MFSIKAHNPDEGDKILKIITGETILSPSEPNVRALIENMISPDYVLC